MLLILQYYQLNYEQYFMGISLQHVNQMIKSKQNVNVYSTDKHLWNILILFCSHFN